MIIYHYSEKLIKDRNNSNNNINQTTQSNR